MRLDHVALGLRDVNPVIATLVGDLGATVLHGGLNPGFRVVQLAVGRVGAQAGPGDGMKLELIEPWATERFDFLARFLDRNGEGPHHLTFTVDDIRDQLARMERAGLQPTSINLDNPWWQEAFFHPKQMFGTVVQLAQTDVVDRIESDASSEGRAEAEFGPRRWWDPPPPRAERTAVLRSVVLSVHDARPAAALYEGLLGGERVEETDGAVELAWSGGRVRLEEHPGRPEGVDRLECAWDAAEEARVVGGANVRLLPA